MFDPSAVSADKQAKALKKKVIGDLIAFATDIVPMDLRHGLLIDAKEIVCGDPTCAPVDTVFTLVWEQGGRGMFALPAPPEDIEKDDLIHFFPDNETLTKWSKGEKAPWPRPPTLRFEVGTRVECRIGPHPVKGWAPGRIVKLHYREPSWPPQATAPYQIWLHDGRLIFAPADSDNVIRMRAPPKEDDPPTPEMPDEFPEDEEEEEDEEDGQGMQGEDDEDGVVMGGTEEEGEGEDDGEEDEGDDEEDGEEGEAGADEDEEQIEEEGAKHKAAQAEGITAAESKHIDVVGEEVLIPPKTTAVSKASDPAPVSVLPPPPPPPQATSAVDRALKTEGAFGGV